MIGSRRLALALVLQVAGVLATSPAARAERLPLKSYSTAEGLAHDFVGGAVQDSHGFLWFCTNDGLSRFDGYRFESFGRESGLPSAEANAMLEVGDGDYWVGTQAGACRFQAATSRCVSTWPGKTAPRLEVFALVRDRSGRLWAGTSAGVYRSDTIEGRFAPAPLRQAPQTPGPRDVLTLIEGGDGSVWMGGFGGLWRVLPDGRVVFYEAAGPGRHAVPSLWFDPGGRLWVASFDGLFVLAPEPASALAGGVVVPRWTHANGASCVRSLPALQAGQACRVTEASLPRHRVYAVVGSSSGTVWAGTQNAGLLEISEAGIRPHTTEEGLTNDALRSLALDREGNLWMGTESRGVMRLSPAGLVSYGRADGLANTRVMSLFTDRNGSLHVATSLLDGPVYRFQDGRFLGAPLRGTDLFVTPRGFGARTAVQDREGDWWIGSGTGLYRFAELRGFGLPAVAEPRARYAADLRAVGPVFLDSRGDVWAGAAAGNGPLLLRFERGAGKASRLALPATLGATGSPTAFGEDRAGGLWVGFDDGVLVRLRDGGFLRLAYPAAPVKRIEEFHLDRTGRLWVAAFGSNGLGFVDHPEAPTPTVSLFAASDGLAIEQGHCITEDRWGRLYVGTRSGVLRIDPASGRARRYGTADGLAASEVHSAATDGEGRIWFGTLAGVSQLVPHLEAPSEPPPIRISALRIGGRDHPLSALGESAVSGLELQPEEAQVEIEYASLGFAPGERIRHRYRLDGADSDWSAPTLRRTVSYARLGPGSYRFLVQAVNGDGVVSAVPASVAFRVLPPIWRRWWFVTTASLLAGLLAHAAFRYRLHALLEVERVRSSIAMDLHDDIGSSLSRIAILSEVARSRGRDAGAPEQTLASIAQISRELVDSLGDIVWAVNPQRDSLTDLAQRMRAFATEIFSAMDVSLRFSAPPDGHPVPLRADLRRQVFLIFKEAVNNAASHSGCREVAVDLGLHGDWLELRVADDGRGIPRDAGESGHGLESMRRRAEAMGGTLDLRSQPGGGTTVTLRVRARR